MTQKHHITHADEIYGGAAVYQKAMASNERKGIRMSHLYAHEFGAVAVNDPDGIVVAGTTTEAAGETLTATGALVASSVATFDVPRAASITSTANNSGVTFTVTGTDEYGETLVEEITGPNNTTVNGGKAFKTITSVASDGAVTGNVDVGSSDILGLPVRIADKGDIMSITVDGRPTAATGNIITAGLTTTQTSTATTGDVRGTITFGGDDPDGTLVFSALVAISDNSSKDAAYGVDQYGG